MVSERALYVKVLLIIVHVTCRIGLLKFTTHDHMDSVSLILRVLRATVGLLPSVYIFLPKSLRVVCVAWTPMTILG